MMIMSSSAKHIGMVGSSKVSLDNEVARNVVRRELEKFDINYDIVKELLEYQSKNPVGTTTSEPLGRDDFPEKKSS